MSQLIHVGPYGFSPTDVVRTFSNLGAWWQHLTDGQPVDVYATLGDELVRRLAAAAGTLPSLDEPLPERLGRIGQQAADTFAGRESSPESVAALTAIWSTISTLSAALRASGCVPTSGSGRVAQINVSDGGVPKRPVERVEVITRGMVGDRQGSRQHHGRPWQALSLWSSEVIEQFAALGDPLAPGLAGENLTLRGLDWAAVRPGMRLRIGTVLAETTSWAIPCRHNAQWFRDGDFRRMSHERGPVSRLYATVVEPGTIAVGDAVTVLP